MPKKENEVDLSLAPDPAPEINAVVNYVAPHTRKITPMKVQSVPDGHDGRLVALDLGDDGKKKIVRVPHRPKEAIAGNTWHWPAKAAALLVALLLLAFHAGANIPTYHTFSAAGLAASPAYVVLPADPNSQIRVVSIFYSSDTNNSTLRFSSGTTMFSLVQSNATTTTVTNVVNSTNGLAPNAIIVLQHNGLTYTNYVASFGNTGTNLYTLPGFGVITNQTTTYGIYGQGPSGFPATNVNWVITGAGWGYQAVPGDDLYLMGPTTSIGAALTNAINGDDIFSGNYGRPVLVQLGPCEFSNWLNLLSAHYDSASQP